MPRGKPGAYDDGRYYYECVMMADLLYRAPAVREDQKIRRGRGYEIPIINHPLRVLPSGGFTSRGDPIPGDYIVTDRPLARSYTSVVEKMVSRPDKDDPLNSAARKMRVKSSKVKFRLLDKHEVTLMFARGIQPYDYEWVDGMFDDESATRDVRLPEEPEPVEAS